MSLSNAVSGLKAAQSSLDVVSNDLANVHTTGFKAGTQRFADIYPSVVGGAGLGVRASHIERDFNQGGVDRTGNPLDLAVQGDGYFITDRSGITQYTRDGNFHLNPETGQIVNASGDPVMGYANGAVGGQIQPLTVDQTPQGAKATSTIGLAANLDSNATPPTTNPFDPTDPTSYNVSTSAIAYDSLGNPNKVELYYRLAGPATPGAPGDWDIFAQAFNSDGTQAGAFQNITTLQFNSDGTLSGGGTGTMGPIQWDDGSANSNLTFNLGQTALSSNEFAVSKVTHDGHPPGTYQGVEVDSSGRILAQYSNGEQQEVGQAAVATFVNDQGLTPVSGNGFLATSASGPAAVNAPGQGQAGNIASGQLEKSNVDMADALVRLITSQQAYQANTKSISADKQDVQRLLQV